MNGHENKELEVAAAASQSHNESPLKPFKDERPKGNERERGSKKEIKTSQTTFLYVLSQFRRFFPSLFSIYICSFSFLFFSFFNRHSYWISHSLTVCVRSVCCMILAVWCVHTFSIAYTLLTLLLMLLLLLKDATALMLHKLLRAVSYSLTKISFSIIFGHCCCCWWWCCCCLCCDCRNIFPIILPLSPACVWQYHCYIFLLESLATWNLQ